MVDGASSNNFVERLARALAKTDQIPFEENPDRFRRLARAAMTEFQNPTPIYPSLPTFFTYLIANVYRASLRSWVISAASISFLSSA